MTGSKATGATRPIRSRLLFLSAAGAVIVLGLASRRYPALLPSAFGKYPGDALWALMVFLLAAAFLRSASTLRVALVALGIAFSVEFSQLCQAPWLNALRRMTLGHLVLGSRFHAPDLIAYAAGVALGVLADRLLIKLRQV